MKAQTISGPVELTAEMIRPGMVFVWDRMYFTVRSPESDWVMCDALVKARELPAKADAFIGCDPAIAAREDCVTYGIAPGIDAGIHSFARIPAGGALDLSKPENIRKGMIFRHKGREVVAACDEQFSIAVGTADVELLGCHPTLAHREDCVRFGIPLRCHQHGVPDAPIDAGAHWFARLRDGGAVDLRGPGQFLHGIRLSGPGGHFIGLDARHAPPEDVRRLCCGERETADRFDATTGAYLPARWSTCTLAIGDHEEHEDIATGVKWKAGAVRFHDGPTTGSTVYTGVDYGRDDTAGVAVAKVRHAFGATLEWSASDLPPGPVTNWKAKTGGQRLVAESRPGSPEWIRAKVRKDGYECEVTQTANGPDVVGVTVYGADAAYCGRLSNWLALEMPLGVHAFVGQAPMRATGKGTLMAAVEYDTPQEKAHAAARGGVADMERAGVIRPLRDVRGVSSVFSPKQGVVTDRGSYIEYEPYAGTFLPNVCEEVSAIAAHGKPVRFTVNDTTVEAQPCDDAEAVRGKWFLARAEAQAPSKANAPKVDFATAYAVAISAPYGENLSRREVARSFCGFFAGMKAWQTGLAGQVAARDAAVAKAIADVPTGCDPQRWANVVRVLAADAQESIQRLEWWRTTAFMPSMWAPFVSAYARERRSGYGREMAAERVRDGSVCALRLFAAYEAGR